MYICFRCWTLCELSLRGLRFNLKLWMEHRVPWSVCGSPRGPDDASVGGGLVTASLQPRATSPQSQCVCYMRGCQGSVPHGMLPALLFPKHSFPAMCPKSLLLLLLSRFSRVRLCATPQTAGHQGPPSLGFSRQEYWSGLPCPPPEDLCDPGSNLCLLCLLHCQAGSLPLSHLGNLPFLNIYVIKHQLLVVLFIEK